MKTIFISFPCSLRKRFFFTILPFVFLFLTIFLSLSGVSTAKAQQTTLPEAIEDNSFLIEEAYNQEAGVVQHIFNVLYFPRPPRDVLFSFTQEWPVVNQTHQLSYTIPALFLDEEGQGLGDVMLNYRYQLFYKDDWAAVAPRLSVIFPTGNTHKGLGFGSTGVQINFPVSRRWTEHFITHFNVGGTFLPGSHTTLSSGVEAKKTLTFANAGLSLVWLMNPHFNFLLEYNTNFASEINDAGNVHRFTEFILNPALRGAIDVGSLQIVPGIGVPLTWNGGNLQTGIFFYLSFEHPFMKMKESN